MIEKWQRRDAKLEKRRRRMPVHGQRYVQVMQQVQAKRAKEASRG